MASSSSSRQMKHQVFLSFRGEDTRLNFTSHLLKALKHTGINVFFGEDTLEKGDQLSLALSQAIATSNLSIIVLSVNYASSKSCLAELSDIMDRKDTKGHIVLPIFYHVDPSDVRNLAGRFKISFDEHESGKLDQVQQWQTAFVEVGKLKGWHIEGGKFDRPETEYIKDIVEYVIKKLMNSKAGSASEELVRIDDKKRTILRLIDQEDSRVIGLWGMGGIGKTTLADAVYKEAFPKFEDHYFLQNVCEKSQKQGIESLRNEFLSELLNQKICIDTPSIGLTLIERLKNKRVIVVLDDVNDPDQIDSLGVKYFGDGSKIIITSRDRQVLQNGGANKIYEVKKLNENESLQLFSTFAFKLLNPSVDFRDLSNKFVEYAQGSPLALKVLGSKLYTKTKKDWESEVEKLKEYGQPKILQILKRSFGELDEIEKNIFLDIACIFKRLSMQEAEEILSCCYKGAMCGITNLVDKCLLDIDRRYGEGISVHDMLEEMGKDIVRQESKSIGMRSRLWSLEDVDKVLRYSKVSAYCLLDMSQIKDELRLCPSSFRSMLNLKYLHFYSFNSNKRLIADEHDNVSLPNELRSLFWDYYPFKNLSSFKPNNLVTLNLSYGNMEQFWDNDNHQDLVNLREIFLIGCKNLRKIPRLPGAINLKFLDWTGCVSLVELPCLNHLASLKWLYLVDCYSLKKFPELPKNIEELYLSESGIEVVPDSIEHLARLERLDLRYLRVKNISSHISTLESLWQLDLSYCPIAKFPEIPRNLKELRLLGTQIEELPSCFDCQSSLTHLVLSGTSIKTVDVRSMIIRFENLVSLKMNDCKSLELLSEVPPSLGCLEAHGCTSLEKVTFTDQNLFEVPDDVFTIFSNCFKLNQDSIDIKETAMFKIPNLLGALNLERLDCENCESLVKLPSLARLTSLKTLRIKGRRSLKKFPEIPNNFYELDLSETGIKKVPDFIERLDRLERLTLTNSMVKDVSSNISKLKSLKVLDLSGCPIVRSPEIPRSLTGLYLSGTQIEEVDLSSNSVSSNSRAKDASSDGCPIVKSSFPTVDVPSPSLMFMCMDRCNSLKLLSELPPYLHELNVHDCTSLEKVSFADQNLYQFDYLDADDPCFHAFTMLFCNCFNLNQESINNIEANAMLKIGSLAKKWAAGFDWDDFDEDFPSFICCFPGNKISGNKFKCQSENSFLSLKIAPNGGSGSRFLVFAICVVANLTYCPALDRLECICEYQLIGAGGGNGGGGHEKLRSVILFSGLPEPEKFMGDYVFILSSINMVDEDKNYEEASFEFKIRYLIFDEEEDCEVEYLLMFKRIEVERCGVHVFYVDAESNADSNVESSENPNLNEMSTDESNDSLYSAEDAIFEEVDGDTQPRLQL
ncbi:hypothetical protein PVK06_036865 [Gossypium arboreum]|uniref:TIR domain-containing protein n=1 Tax=Gossypium arboreum TaxID=29729 RepID=A0ABR0NL09_GOSAR|nr:hypothetical protein PVK06_036865 [Gossypium arboreum]